MCRSIKVLRRPDEPATTGEIEAAARQFVRKVSGYRTPSARNSAAFDAAIAEVAVDLAAAPGGPRRDGRGRSGSLEAGTRPDAARGTSLARAPASAPGRGSGLTSDQPSRRARDDPARRAAVMPIVAADRPWWVRPGLDDRRRPARDRRPRRRGARPRARDAAVRLRPRPLRARTPSASATPSTGPGCRIASAFALKANREPEVLPPARSARGRLVGIDACSPGEVLHALDAWLAAGRDQLHRDERVRARPRRRPGPPAST